MTHSALITGSTCGIGLGIAHRLAKEGYAVTAVSRTESRLKTLIDELGKGEHSFLVADLSTSEGIDRVAQELLQKHFDLLVNNAGVGVYGPFAATERVLMALVRAGADRQHMHERLRQHSLKAWESIKAGRPNPEVVNEYRRQSRC